MQMLPLTSHAFTPRSDITRTHSHCNAAVMCARRLLRVRQSCHVWTACHIMLVSYRPTAVYNVRDRYNAIMFYDLDYKRICADNGLYFYLFVCVLFRPGLELLLATLGTSLSRLHHNFASFGKFQPLHFPLWNL